MLVNVIELQLQLLDSGSNELQLHFDCNSITN